MNDKCCICQNSLDEEDNTNDGIICKDCDKKGLEPDEYGS